MFSLLIIFIIQVVNGQQNYQYTSSICNSYDTSDDTRPSVGTSCKTITGTATSNVPSALDMSATPSLGVHIIAGNNADQNMLTAYPRNVANSVNKPQVLELDSYFASSSQTVYSSWVAQWPYCSSKGEACRCKGGYVTIMRGKAAVPSTSDRNVFILSQSNQTEDSILCDVSLPQFSSSKARQYNLITSLDDYHCKCGRDVSIQEQWRWAGDLCPPLNRQWRPSSSSFQDPCAPFVETYDTTFSQSYFGRGLFGVYPPYSKNNPKPFPMIWKSLKKTNGGAAPVNSAYTLKVSVPASTDNEAVIKFVDTHGDGWENGKLSIYADVNNQSAAGLLPIKRSWTRQDTYKRDRGSDEGQNGGQTSNSRTCHPKWLMLAPFDGTPEMCRNKCRDTSSWYTKTPLKQCTHYAWSAKGTDPVQRYSYFDGEGPAVTTYFVNNSPKYYGKCYIYHVDYDMRMMDEVTYKRKYFSTETTMNNGGRRLNSNMPDSINKLSWAQAKAECTKHGMDLCTKDQLCHNGDSMFRPLVAHDEATFSNNDYTIDVATLGGTIYPTNTYTTLFDGSETSAKKHRCASKDGPPWGTKSDFQNTRKLVFCCRSISQSMMNSNANHANTGVLKHTPDCFTVSGDRTVTATELNNNPRAALMNNERYAVFKHKSLLNGKLCVCVFFFFSCIFICTFYMWYTVKISYKNYIYFFLLIQIKIISQAIHFMFKIVILKHVVRHLRPPY